MTTRYSSLRSGMAAALLPLLLFGPEVQAQSAATPAQACNDTWMATTTTNAPVPRSSHTAVWTGTEMIIWGGGSLTDYFNTGGRYNPSNGTWTATSNLNPPERRAHHTAVWTGSEMIVWGGFTGGSVSGVGGKYNPTTDSWTPTSMTMAPPARADHIAVWTGSEMVVWGGFAYSAGGHLLDTGGRYHPSTNTWASVSVENAPIGRAFPSAIWTGNEMIVWGGENDSSVLDTGGRYNPS